MNLSKKKMKKKSIKIKVKTKTKIKIPKILNHTKIKVSKNNQQLIILYIKKINKNNYRKIIIQT